MVIHLLLLSLLLLPLLTSPAHAQSTAVPTPTPTPTVSLWPEQTFPSAADVTWITLEDLGFYEDEHLLGYVSEVEFRFALPQAWLLDDTMFFRLDISHSSLLVPERSSVTVFVDDLPAGSAVLDQTNAQHGQIIFQGRWDTRQRNHSLRLKFYMRINYDICMDLDSPALWAIVHVTSAIGVRYRPNISDVNLSLYPYPLFTSRALQPTSIAFVLGDSTSPIHLQAVGRIAAKMGQMAGNTKHLDISAFDLAHLTPESTAKANLVLVGHPWEFPFLKMWQDRLPLPLTDDGQGFVDPQGRPVDPDTGVIQVLRSPWNEQRVVVIVSGGSDEALTRASKALSHEESIVLMEGPYALVPEEPKVSPTIRVPGLNPQGVSTFGEVMDREEDIVVYGGGTHKINFLLSIPPSWRLTKGVAIMLKFAHSPILWGERSTIEVRLNKSLQRSILLTEANANPTQVEIPLGFSMFKPGLNSVEITIRPRIKKEVCVFQNVEDMWVMVYMDSLLVLPHEESGAFEPALDFYPFPFNSPDLSDATIVLPPNPSLTELTGAVRIATRLGAVARHPDLDLHIVPASALGNMAKEDHLLIIGGADRNPVVSVIDLDLTVEGITRKILESESAPLAVIIDNQPIAAIEEVRSPWNPTRGVLVITANSERAFEQAIHMLSTQDPVPDLKGNLVIVNEWGVAQPIITRWPTPTPLPVSVPTPPARLLELPRGGSMRWFYVGGLLVLNLFLAAIVVSLWRRRRT